MRRLFRIMAIVAVASGLAFGFQGAASADHKHHGGHGHHGGHRHAGGHHQGGHGSFYGGINYGGIGVYYRSGPRWHNTSHYDYHPGEFRRHGNHYHYVPGHYDYHRSGHWHR
jgi:hypothetical protein